jgi:hypothetical protein
MVSRLIGLVLGLLLAAVGFVIAKPVAVAGLPSVSLGDFEGLRGLIGWLALGLGVAAIVTNLWPGRSQPKRRSRPMGAAAPITFADDPPQPTPAPVMAANVGHPVVTQEAPAPAPMPLASMPPLVFEPVRAAAPDPAPQAAPAPAHIAAITPAAVTAAAPAVAWNLAAELPSVQVAAPQPAPVATPVVAPVAAPAAAPVAAPASASPAAAENAPQETFTSLRQQLHATVREERWTEAGRLLQRLPKLALTHRDRMLSAQDLGDFHRSQGRGDDASEAYGQALSYARLLHEIEPEDPIAAADLAGSLVNVGDMASDEGRLDAALGAYEEAVGLRRKAVATGGARRTDRRALSIALERLADAREDRGHRVRALDLYRESVEIAGALAAEDPQRYGADLVGTRTRLTELEERLSI